MYLGALLGNLLGTGRLSDRAQAGPRSLERLFGGLKPRLGLLQLGFPRHPQEAPLPRDIHLCQLALRVRMLQSFARRAHSRAPLLHLDARHSAFLIEPLVARLIALRLIQGDARALHARHCRTKGGLRLLQRRARGIVRFSERPRLLYLPARLRDARLRLANLGLRLLALGRGAPREQLPQPLFRAHQPRLRICHPRLDLRARLLDLRGKSAPLHLQKLRLRRGNRRAGLL